MCLGVLCSQNSHMRILQFEQISLPLGMSICITKHRSRMHHTDLSQERSFAFTFPSNTPSFWHLNTDLDFRLGEPFPPPQKTYTFERCNCPFLAPVYHKRNSQFTCQASPGKLGLNHSPHFRPRLLPLRGTPCTSALFSTLATSGSSISPPSAFLRQDDKSQTALQPPRISCPGDAQQAIGNWSEPGAPEEVKKWRGQFGNH